MGTTAPDHDYLTAEEGRKRCWGGSKKVWEEVKGVVAFCSDIATVIQAARRC